jgi:hypothetical protein
MMVKSIVSVGANGNGTQKNLSLVSYQLSLGAGKLKAKSAQQLNDH